MNRPNTVFWSLVAAAAVSALAVALLAAAAHGRRRVLKEARAI